MHTHTCSESSHTATFGCVFCPCQPSCRTFHHSPALVAPLFLWWGYLLCPTHTHFPDFNFHAHAHTCSCQPSCHAPPRPFPPEPHHARSHADVRSLHNAVVTPPHVMTQNTLRNSHLRAGRDNALTARIPHSFTHHL